MLGLQLVVGNVVLSLRPGGSDAFTRGLDEVRRNLNGGALRNAYIRQEFALKLQTKPKPSNASSLDSSFP